MALRLHNSLSGEKETFQPAVAGRVSMYNCGPTVYNFAHLGNFRAYVFVDLLRRVLELRGYAVEQTMNITDVEDKIIREAKLCGASIREFTEPYLQAFLEDLEYLRVREAEHRPRATDHIPEMLEMIGALEKRGHVYQAEGAVYFKIASFERYGRLSRLDPAQLRAAAEGRFQADEYDKENARDFALWKPAGEEEAAAEARWESPWGEGRPGWHLECSAMIRGVYGQSGVDIHTGGVDLQFPHHENEIAQSECAYPNDRFVRYWLHNEHLLVEGKKMSKSLGNFFTLRELTEPDSVNQLVQEGRAPESLAKLARRPAALRRAMRQLLLGVHYRQKLNFTFQGLESAESACSRLQRMADRLREITGLGRADLEALDRNMLAEERAQGAKPGELRSASVGSAAPEEVANARREFLEALDDDLNIARAQAAAFELVRGLNTRLAETPAQDGSGDADSAYAALCREALLFLYQANLVLDAIDFTTTEDELERESADGGVSGEERAQIDALVEARQAARKAKDFAEADRIRDELSARGIVVKDTPQGPVWERA